MWEERWDSTSEWLEGEWVERWMSSEELLTGVFWKRWISTNECPWGVLEKRWNSTAGLREWVWEKRWSCSTEMTGRSVGSKVRIHWTTWIQQQYLNGIYLEVKVDSRTCLTDAGKSWGWFFFLRSSWLPFTIPRCVPFLPFLLTGILDPPVCK